jgi:restriction system protein
MAELEKPPEPRVPAQEELMWPALVAMKELGGSATNQELLERVIDTLHIPEAVQDVLDPQGESKLWHNLRWAQTRLRKFGALENVSYRVWAITEKGRALEEKDLKKIPAELRRQYGVGSRKKAEPVGDIEDVQLERDKWKAELLAVLTSKMDAHAFERLAQRILRESGFVRVQVTGRSGDGGIDGVGVFQLGLLSFLVCFQCKKYKGSVPPGDVRDFRGAMAGRADKGLFITTGTFTAGAQKEAARVAPPIDLIDGDRLCDLLKELKLGVDVKTAEEVNINAPWLTTQI